MPPEPIVIIGEFAIEPEPDRAKVPAVIVVFPEYVLAPDNVNVPEPEPDFVRFLEDPEMTVEINIFPVLSIPITLLVELASATVIVPEEPAFNVSELVPLCLITIFSTLFTVTPFKVSVPPVDDEPIEIFLLEGRKFTAPTDQLPLKLLELKLTPNVAAVAFEPPKFAAREDGNSAMVEAPQVGGELQFEDVNKAVEVVLLLKV